MNMLPRWDDIAKGVVVGMERTIAAQQLEVIKSRAVALTVEELELVQNDGETSIEFESRKLRHRGTIGSTKQDTIFKASLLNNYLDEYEKLLEGKSMEFSDEPIDTSLFDGANDGTSAIEK